MGQRMKEVEELEVEVDVSSHEDKSNGRMGIRLQDRNRHYVHGSEEDDGDYRNER